MFAGHFGLAAAVKGKAPEVPLWALMLSTQWLDIAFGPLLAAGVETMQPIEGPGGYGRWVFHAYYTHSLAGALILSAVAGLAARRWWGKRGGTVVGGLAFSHWILDLLVHRGDLPILPGNLGNLPLLGFGLWRFPGVSIALEGALVVAGALLYARSLLRGREGRTNRWSFPAAMAMAALLVLALVTDVVGVG